MIDSPDVALRRQIEDLLIKDSRTKDDVIEVMCLAGQVTLSGKVRKPANKTAAEEIARAVPGVLVLHNELRV